MNPQAAWMIPNLQSASAFSPNVFIKCLLNTMHCARCSLQNSTVGSHENEPQSCR